MIIADSFIEQRDRGGRARGRETSRRWLGRREEFGSAGSSGLGSAGLWIPDKSSGSTRPAPPLYAARVAAPPRPAPPCASRCALPRAPLHPPSTSAGRCPLPLAGLGKTSSGSASGLRARGPCASLLQRPQGRRGPTSGCASDPLQGPPPLPQPASPPQDSHAHAFLGTHFPRRITTLGSTTAGVCQVPGTAPGSLLTFGPALRTGQAQPPGVRGGGVSGRWARRAPAARGQPRPRRPSRDPGARSSGLESAKPELQDPAPHDRLQLLSPSQRGAGSWQEFQPEVAPAVFLLEPGRTRGLPFSSQAHVPSLPSP